MSRMLLAPWTLAGAIAAPSPTLEWQAPAGCPDDETVTAMTMDLLRERPASAPQLTARAVVTRNARFEVTLELRSIDGDVRRTLAAHDCQLLARSVALLVAVHLDAVTVAQRIAPTLAPPEPPPIVPPPQSLEDDPSPAPPPRFEPLPPSPAPESPPVPEASFGGHLRLEGGLDAGILPGLGGDVSLVGGVGAARWRVELGVVGAPGRTRGFGETTARFDRVGGLARGCAIWRVPPRRDTLALLGCLGVEASALNARTLAPSVPSPRWAPWAGALVGGAARISLVGPLGLWLGVEAVIALVRPGFYVGTAPNSPYQTGQAGVRANFGLDLQFVARKRRPRTTD